MNEFSEGIKVLSTDTKVSAKRYAPDSWKNADLTANRYFPQVMAAKAVLLGKAILTSYREGEITNWRDICNLEYNSDQIGDILQTMDRFHLKPENGIKTVSVNHPLASAQDMDTVTEQRIQRLSKDTRGIALDLIFDWIRVTEKSNLDFPDLHRASFTLEEKLLIIEEYYSNPRYNEKSLVLDKIFNKLSSLFDVKDREGVGESYSYVHTDFQRTAYHYTRGEASAQQFNRSKQGYEPNLESLKLLAELGVDEVIEDSNIVELQNNHTEITQNLLYKFQVQLVK